MALDLPRCECGHQAGDHNTGRPAGPLAPMRYGCCLMPGCRCLEYSHNRPVPSLHANAGERLAADRRRWRQAEATVAAWDQ